MDEKQEYRLKALALVLKALSHETRLKILSLLNKNPKTWTQILQELKINSKSLRDHLQYLLDRDLIKKGEQVCFEITHAGRMLLEISLKEILAVIELED